MNDLALNIKGKSYSGWTALSVEKSLDQLAGTFGLAVSNKLQDWKIRMGDECSITIDGQKVITGYVEEMPISYDATSHTVNVLGRDTTGDLVDCCHIGDSKGWEASTTIIHIIRSLCKPFGISVAVDKNLRSMVNTKIGTQFNAGEGETVFECIVKLCRMKAILPVNYGDGYLTLTRAGTSRANDSLELGVNILFGSLNQTDRERFSRYDVKAQRKGEDEIGNEEITRNHGIAHDKVIRRYRPLTVIAETQADNKTCRERAHWEARVRAGKSRSTEYTVPGWVQSNGKVWALNSLVRVRDNFAQVDGTMLINRLSFVLSNEEGTITRVGVTNREAYSLHEVPLTEISTRDDFDQAIIDKYGKKVLDPTKKVVQKVIK